VTTAAPSEAPHAPAAEDANVFRVLFAAYPDALIVADPVGTIVRANPAATQLLGYAHDELGGLNVDALVPDGIRPRHAAYREAYARSPRPRPMGTEMELVAKRRDGSEVMVEIALSPLQDHGLPLVVAAIRDIGAYPRVKQALKQARYSESLAQIGRIAVDERDPQVLLDRAPEIARQTLEVDAAMVFLAENDLRFVRVAAGVGMVPGEEIGARIPYDPDSSPGLVLSQGVPLIVSDYRRETRFMPPQRYLDAGLVSAFLKHLEEVRKKAAVTSNVRLAPSSPSSASSNTGSRRRWSRSDASWRSHSKRRIRAWFPIC
jgi:PAS domain S-box-containing protein